MKISLLGLKVALVQTEDNKKPKGVWIKESRKEMCYLLDGCLSSFWTTGPCNFVTPPYPHKPPVYV